MKNIISKNINFIILDFDGVLTNNAVITDQNGKESVICNRSDGLAINILKKSGYKVMVLSSEKNKVVRARCDKLKIKCFDSINDKKKYLKKLHKEKKINLDNSIYVGNDLNDFYAMQICNFSCCPNDSHKKIIKIADWKLSKDGGQGVVLEIVEKILKINVLEYI